MQNSPLVTVICLCYNHDAFVVETLNSVINQKYENIELIILDDFSTDNSREVIQNWLKDHPKVSFITNDSNLGNTKSFNKALKLAKGDYIIDLAADDILLPNCIQLQINTFKNSPYKNLGLVYGNAELITENGSFDSYYFPVDSQKKIIEPRKTGDVYLSILSGGNSLCSVSAMMKKTVLDELKGFDEELYYEDLDFWIRASRQYEFDFIDEILVQKRILKSAMTSDFFKKNNARAKKINYSTYLIIKKAIQLNRTKEENKAILKRVHFELILAFKTRNYVLLLRYLWLKIKLQTTF
ncbi:glycosyltransferase [Flavobacterium sp.]|uniref:glycosyltransferase family 2 protein n=1 Tax=Flavobacterium sp. TaxID=239 RepID=UPI002638D961|nr:glycosyltransferase [Flavobacterium sp.]